ncbi:MAG: HD domain-containing protein [Candidatus Paceibacterota bacterium]
MIITPLVQQALNRATLLHDGQYRKDDTMPYIVHPVSVALILSQYTDDDEVLAAALLHDVLEDVAGYREQDMRDEFGDRVTDIVRGVTEPKDPNKPAAERLPWRELKERYMENLRTAPEESVLVAAADKIHNLQSFVETIEREGARTWEIFHSTAEERLWYFEQVLAIVADRLEGGLVERFRASHQRFCEAVAAL